MSASSMPPPPSPLAHRRSRLYTNVNYPPSPPYSPETSPCASRHISLSKGATFHVPSSPPTHDSPVLSIRHLARRSPTCSQSSLISLVFEKEEGAARSIQDFENTFSGARGKRRAHRRGTDKFHDTIGSYPSAPLPSDEGLGSSVSSSADKGLTQAFERALDLDSGLGSSIKSEKAECTPVQLRVGISEEDSLPVQGLIQGVVNTESKIRQHSLASEASSAIVRSISPMLPGSSRQPQLSSFACQKFADNILQPILREDRFKFFHPLVAALGSRTNKTIRCLRDLEQTLIFEPLVGTTSRMYRNTNIDYCSFVQKRLDISHNLYRSFEEFSIQLVLDTFHHLSETEQRRASDRPYDNGYFLDLVQQVGRLAAQVGAARRARSSESVDATEIEGMDYSLFVPAPSASVIRISHCHRDDEVTLEGGLGETGRPAELVRWKNGEGVSLRTNKRYEAQPLIKRQRSNESLDADAERSMARRKKNAEARVVELRCSDSSCGRIFHRKCDLAKHERTHSRRFKCPEQTCKYHEQGLPTEKERDRHINDKHSANPRYFHCKFCPFKTKRDSNCKQHMENRHGWSYERVKGNTKTTRTPQQTPQTPALSTPSVSDDWGTTSMTGSDGGSNFTPYTTSMDDVVDKVQAVTNPYQVSLFPNPPPQSASYGYGSPDIDFNSPLYDTHCTGPNTGSWGLASPSGQVQSYLNPATTSAHTPGNAVTVPPFDPLYIGIGYHGVFPAEMPDTNSRSLQPQSNDPSISNMSPMVMQDDLFLAPQQMAQPPEYITSNSYTNITDLPTDDFALFGASGDPSMLPSTAEVPSPVSMDFYDNIETEYSDSELGRYVNL